MQCLSCTDNRKGVLCYKLEIRKHCAKTFCQRFDCFSCRQGRCMTTKTSGMTLAKLYLIVQRTFSPSCRSQLRRVCSDLCCLQHTVYTYSSGGTGMGVGFLDPTFLVASLTPYGAEIKCFDTVIDSKTRTHSCLAQVRKLPRNTLVSSTMKYLAGSWQYFQLYLRVQTYGRERDSKLRTYVS